MYRLQHTHWCYIPQNGDVSAAVADPTMALQNVSVERKHGFTTMQFIRPLNAGSAPINPARFQYTLAVGVSNCNTSNCNTSESYTTTHGTGSFDRFCDKARRKIVTHEDMRRTNGALLTDCWTVLMYNCVLSMDRPGSRY